ncbi:MAG TPA: S8 family serine peptidase [Thermoanaerobaculia bacterium]|jgi:hypothetical protein|nr:S8 family serine peptidase [Thermoanaerobaculia bacterium]
MTITLRGRSRLSLLAAVVILSGAPSLSGQWRLTDPPPEKAAEPTVFRVDESKHVDVIIELNAPPLLEARRTQDVRLASSNLDALTTRLAKDLTRIEGQARDRVAAQASEASALRHTYRITFAGASATVSRESLPAIRALSYVRAVHQDGEVKAHLATSLPHIGVPEVWTQYGLRGKGIVVAIIDTGIDYRHYAFGGGFGPGFKVAGGYDFANNDADPLDDHGHGTHVAGIVAANHKYIHGVAPEATLLAYKVLNSEGSGSDSMVLAGVERAMDPDGNGDPSDHADIVNMSLGGSADFDDPLVAAVERASAAGVVFCVSAGNSWIAATLGSPAIAPSAITVGATQIPDRLAVFNSGGPVGGAWAMKPEVAAPGVAIASASLNNSSMVLSGTSMAAPHVSGLVALLLELHPDWTAQDIKAALVTTAKPMPHRNEETGISVIFGGGGRIDALRAVAATILPSPATVSFGFVAKRGVLWTSSRTVKLTNRGADAETLKLKADDTRLTIVPDTVTLAAGETAEVTLKLDVPADDEPNEAGLVLSGSISLTGTRSSLHLPWMIVKTDVISATVTGTGEFLMYLSNGGARAAMWAAGPRTFAAFVPYYIASDVMVLTPSTAETDGRLIIRERQPVEGLTEVTISPDEASYVLRVEGVDERGVPLNRISPDAPGVLWHEFRLPSLSEIRLLHIGGRRSLRISPLTKAIRIQTYETLQTGSDIYFAAYRHLRGVTKDETLSITPSSWASQKIRLLCKTDCTATVGSGYSGFLDYVYHPIPSPTDPWTIHITPRVETNYDFRAYIRVHEKDLKIDRTANPWTYLSDSIRNVNGRLATSPFGREAVTDYFPPARETPLVLGDGPVVLRLSASRWMLMLQPVGPLGETLGDNARSIKATLERTDGGAVRYRPDRWKGWYEVADERGPYKLAATDDYVVAGRQGRLTMTSFYDTVPGPDGPPTLTMMRIENSYGVAASTVAAQGRPRLVFAARQSTIGNSTLNITHSPVDAAATRVSWRRHGTVEWLPLTVAMTGEDLAYFSDLPGSAGTLFAASLADAVASEGEIDLKFFLKDQHGGTSEVVYEPAFVVGPSASRGRRIR